METKKGSNWEVLRSKLKSKTKLVKRNQTLNEESEAKSSFYPKKRPVTSNNNTIKNKEENQRATAPTAAVEVPVAREDKSSFLLSLERKMRRKIVGLDCEMVGLGLNGKLNALARCSLVNFDGEVLYDRIIRPKGLVTDFRTRWSGIKKSDLRKEKDNVVTFEECQEEVAKLLKDKILVGHALQNDMSVLLLSHPRSKIRDTSRYHPYMRQTGKFRKFRPRSLKELTLQFLGKKIQSGEHDSVEDARCAVLLYRREMENWENALVQQKKEGFQKAKVKSQGGNGLSVVEFVPNDQQGHSEEKDDERGYDFDTTSSNRDNGLRFSSSITISKDDLQPSRKRSLSCKQQQTAADATTVINKLIEETKKVDELVQNRHQHSSSSQLIKDPAEGGETTVKKKRKLSHFLIEELEGREIAEYSSAESNVVVFDSPQTKSEVRRKSEWGKVFKSNKKMKRQRLE